MRLVQISDTHFGTERPEVVEALLAQVQELAPDVAVLAGDITQRARPGQFADAARFFAALAARHRIAIPGNHDLPLFNLFARLFAPYAGYERAFGARESLWCEAGVVLLALDATHPLRIRNGRLPAKPLSHRLGAARERAGEGLLVVAAHQPHWTAWSEDGPQTLIDRDRSARLLAEHRVDLVMSGHVHVPLIEASREVFPALPWSFVMSGSGTAVSLRVRALGGPNSFNVIDLGERMAVSRYDYLPPGFRCVERREFRRGPAGWAPYAAERSASDCAASSSSTRVPSEPV